MADQKDVKINAEGNEKINQEIQEVKQEEKGTEETMKKFYRRLEFLVVVLTAIIGVAATFYSVAARVSVLESKTDALQDNYQRQLDLTETINTRLARIEGKLGINSN